MKKIVFLLFLISTLVSCNSFSKYTKVEGSTLIITNFDCGIGIVGINQIHGDFETLDKEVFHALKGKSGSYDVKLVYDNEKDKFGNTTTISRDLEKINANDLSNYVEVSYWVSATGGTQKILFPIKSEDASLPTEINSSDEIIYSPTDITRPEGAKTFNVDAQYSK